MSSTVLGLLEFASDHLIWVLLTLLVAALVVLTLGWLALRAERTAKAPPGEAKGVSHLGDAVQDKAGHSRAYDSLRLRRSFAQAMGRLRSLLPGARYKYRVPWVLMLGEQGSGKSRSLDSTGLGLALHRERGIAGSGDWPIAWWFLDHGVVIEPAGDGILGGEDDVACARSWRRLLRQLQHHRPRRPLEAVVITLSAAELTALGGPTTEVVRERAERLYRRLFEAQRMLGMRLPVYVLVTHCEVIDGFSPLASALPPELRGTMLGWSNGYNLEAAYTSSWVDEAVDSTRADLVRLQAEVLAESAAAAAAEQVFLLPDAFRQIHERLGVVADALFETSPYHERFFLRGIYFSGSTSTAAQPARSRFVAEARSQFTGERLAPTLTPLPVDQKPPVNAFTHDLFANKIFAEPYLARPVGLALVQRSRTLVATQIGMIVVALAGIASLVLAHLSIASAAETATHVLKTSAERFEDGPGGAMETALAQLESVLNESDERCQVTLVENPGVRVALRDASRQSGDFFRMNRQLLAQILEVQPQSFSTFSMPTSWFGGTRAKVENALSRIYRDYLWRAIYVQLNAKAVAAIVSPSINETGVDATATLKPSLSPAVTPEFVALASLVKELATLGHYVELYRKLRDEQDFTDLDKLAEYAFGISPGGSFDAHENAIRNSLVASGASSPEVPRLCIDGFRELARQAVHARADEFLHATLDAGGLERRLKSLARELDAIGESSPPSGPAAGRGQEIAAKLKRLQNAKAAIDALARDFEGPSLDWISEQSFNPGPRYARTMDQLGTLRLQSSEAQPEIGPALARDVRARADAKLERFRQRISALSSRVLGPLLEQNGNALEGLSASVRSAGDAISNLLEQPFMNADAESAFRREPPPGTQRRWDSSALSETLTVSARYEMFATLESGTFPAFMRAPLRAVGKARFEVWVEGRLAAAQRLVEDDDGMFGGLLESEVRAGAQNLAEASELAVQLLGRLRRLEISRPWADLSYAVAYDALTQLRAVNRLLEGEWLYSPVSGFDSWTGKEGLGFEAFGMAGKNELGAYLILQRSRVELLATQYARPAVTYLSRKRLPEGLAANQALIFRWHQIVSDLDAYRAKRPGNALAALERFILTDLNRVTDQDCLERYGPPGDGRAPSDFFLARKQMLESELRTRCAAIATNELGTAYARVAGTFNSRLAGRFPFVAATKDSPYGWLASADADLDSIRAVYREIDQLPGSVQSVVQGKADPSILPRAVIEFLRQLEDARSFFAPWLAAEAGEPPPALPFEVDFRVLRAKEVGGNQIIEWALSVGGTRIERNDKVRKGEWHLGDPIELGLRWATGSAVRPTPDRARSDLKVNAEEATFTYPGDWSLLRLLRANGQADAPAAKGTGLTLRLQVPAESTDPSQKTAPPATSVFVRLTLLGAKGTKDAGKPISVPRFPTSAPPLD